jgi:hypothetical protein
MWREIVRVRVSLRPLHAEAFSLSLSRLLTTYLVWCLPKMYLKTKTTQARAGVNRVHSIPQLIKR